MALVKQTKQFAFTQGLDSRTTHEFLPLGKLTSLENGAFAKPGKISKRLGLANLPTSKMTTVVDNGSQAMTSMKACFGRGDALHSITENNKNHIAGRAENGFIDEYYVLDESKNLFSYRGPCHNIQAEQINPSIPSLGSGTYAQNMTIDSVASIDVAYANGYNVFVQAYGISSTITGLGISIVDSTTNETVFTQVLGSSYTFTSYARAIALSSTRVLIIAGVSTNRLIGYTFDLTNIAPVTETSEIIFTTNFDAANNIYDAYKHSLNNRLYIAFKNQAAGTLTYNSYTTIPTSGAAAVTNTVTQADVVSNFIAAFGENTFSGVYVCYGKAATGTFTARFSTALVLLTGPTSLSATIAKNCSPAYGTCSDGNGNTLCPFITEEFDATSGLNTWNLYCWSNGALSTLKANLVKGLTLKSKIYITNFGAQQNCVLLCGNYLDSTEKADFLVHLQIVGFVGLGVWPVCQTLYTDAGSQFPGWVNNLNDAGGSYSPIIVACFHSTYQSADNLGVTKNLFRAVGQKFTFNEPGKYQYKEINNLTYFNGGFPCVFDGDSLFEACFLHSPYTYTIAASVAAGALTLLGRYSYIAVYNYFDSSGNRHFSMPSAPIAVTLTGAQNTVTFNAIYPPLSMHPLTPIEIYRTAANGTLYYHEATLVSGAFGQPVTHTSTLADSTLITRETLYSTGGVLEYHNLNSTKSITVWNNRIFALTKDGVFFSNKLSSGFPATFNLALNLNTVAGKGPPTAIAALRDKLIIFFAKDIFYITGDGPNDIGVGSFSSLELVQAGIGCRESTDVVEAKESVYFRSNDGWRELTGSLSVGYMGSELDFFITKDSVIYGGVYLDDLHQVRITDGNMTYCYDTILKQWSIAPEWAHKNISIIKDRYTTVLNNSIGTSGYENQDNYNDATTNTNYSLLIRTGWINFDNILGFERIYEIIILGRYWSANTVNITIFYDYNPTIAETFTFDPSGKGITRYFDDDIYVDDSGPSVSPMQFKIKPQQQRCQSFRIEITDSFGSGSNQGFDFVGLNAVIGVKSVNSKMRDAATATHASGTVGSGL